MQRKAIAGLITVGLLLGGPLQAQEADAPQLADVWYMQPGPGHGSKFEKAFKQHIELREEKGDPQQWLVFQPVIGSKLDYYVVRACCFEWADFDAHDEWYAEHEEIGEHWDDHVAEHVVAYEHYIHEMDLENSHWPEDDDDFRYYGVTRWEVEPGAVAVDAMKARFSQMAKEGELDSHWLWERRMGGADELSVITPYENYADMAEPEKTLGEIMIEQMDSEEDAMEMFEEWGELFETGSYSVYRYREDLSMDGEDD